MKIVGLTGGIGSGKSTVAKIFEVIGIPVFYADQTGKELLHNDPDLRENVQKTFGEEVYARDHGLDTKALAGKVFHDKAALQKLNALVHPAVRKAFTDWVYSQPSYLAYVIQEAALLFETGADEHFDYMISVSAPENIRVNRIMEREQMEKKDVLARMENQLPQAKKDERSDQVIINDGRHLVIPQVMTFHKKLIKTG